MKDGDRDGEDEDTEPVAITISNTRDIAKVWIGGVEYKDIANSTGQSNPPANFTNNNGPSNSPGSGSDSGSGSGSRNSATTSAVLGWLSFGSLQIWMMLYLLMQCQFEPSGSSLM